MCDREKEIAIQKFQDCLDEFFPSHKVIDFSSASRSNYQTKVVTESGQVFGFKAWTAAKPEDGGEAGCAERDKYLNLVAGLVNAPNHCEVKYTSKLRLGSFEDRIVAVSKWVPNAESLEGMSESDLELLKGGAKDFFRQYGEWLAVLDAMGFRDWTPNNFVWSQDDKTLAMVDMDWSFNFGLDQVHDYCFPLQRLKGIQKEDLDECVEALGVGIDSMQARLKAKLDSICERLAKSERDEIRKYVLSIDPALKSKATERVIASLQ